MLGALIGAAAGGLGSLFGGGGQTTSTVPDAQTQKIRDAIMQQAGGMAGNPGYQALLQNYQGYGQLGNLGIGAMGGDQAAFGHFMNPYLQNVLKQSNNQFDILGRKAQMGVNEAATQAGAFGGSRAAVASGVAGANVANQQAMTNSQLLYGGFNDAQQRAQQAAGLGLQGNQGYMNALGFPTDLYAKALPGGGSTTTQSGGGGGVGGFISGALGGGMLGQNLGFGGGGGGQSQGQTFPWSAHF